MVLKTVDIQDNKKHNPDGPSLISEVSESSERARTKLAALYSATKSLQNSCTAKLQLFSGILEAK